jgi:hypothetical protein
VTAQGERKRYVSARNPLIERAGIVTTEPEALVLKREGPARAEGDHNARIERQALIGLFIGGDPPTPSFDR